MMKRAITAVFMVLALVGLIGMADVQAAISNTAKFPGRLQPVIGKRTRIAVTVAADTF